MLMMPITVISGPDSIMYGSTSYRWHIADSGVKETNKQTNLSCEMKSVEDTFVTDTFVISPPFEAMFWRRFLTSIYEWIAMHEQVTQKPQAVNHRENLGNNVPDKLRVFSKITCLNSEGDLGLVLLGHYKNILSKLDYVASLFFRLGRCTQY